MKEYLVKQGYHNVYKTTDIEQMLNCIRLLLSEENILVNHGFDLEIEVRIPEWEANANEGRTGG
jgi:hypothetical protein